MFTAFKYWNQGKERSLAGWFRWKFQHDIRLIEFYDDVAYLVMRNNVTNEHVISTMNLMDDPDIATIWSDDRSFEPRLDLYLDQDRLIVTDGPDQNGRATKNIELPPGTYVEQDLTYLQFTKSSGTFFSAYPTIIPETGNPYINVPKAVLDASTAYNLGLVYTMEIELPGFYVKDENKVDRVNLPMVETVNIELYLSGSYTVVLEKLGYPDRLLYFDAKEADIYLG